MSTQNLLHRRSVFLHTLNAFSAKNNKKINFRFMKEMKIISKFFSLGAIKKVVK